MIRINAVTRLSDYYPISDLETFMHLASTALRGGSHKLNPHFFSPRHPRLDLGYRPSQYLSSTPALGAGPIRYFGGALLSAVYGPRARPEDCGEI